MEEKMKVMTLIVFFILFSPSTSFSKGLYGKKYCLKSGFYCLKITKKTSWKKLFPNRKKRKLVMKLNRLNIRLKKGFILAIPFNTKNKVLIDYSPFPKWIRAPKKKVFIWDPKLLAWAAYAPNGKLLRWGPGVGGKKYCKDVNRSCKTIVGRFRVIAKGDAKTRSYKYPRGCKGEECTPIPWFIKFHKAGFGIHGSDKIPGKHASHGCIRVFLDDAKWLNKKFTRYGTKIIIRPY